MANNLTEAQKQELAQQLTVGRHAMMLFLRTMMQAHASLKVTEPEMAQQLREGTAAILLGGRHFADYFESMQPILGSHLDTAESTVRKAFENGGL